MTSDDGPLLLVTGGTGFVGSALVRRLVEAGRDVHVLARDPSRVERPLGASTTLHRGDLLDPPSVDAAVRSFCERAREAERPAQVVHCAAVISYRTDAGELSRRVNVEGTRCVLDACLQHGVSRVCHVSSVVALGPAPDGETCLDEEAGYDGAALRSAYVTTKRAAEDFALAVTRQLDVVVVEPGAVFGPAPTGSNTNRFLVRLARGKFPLAPPGSLAVVGVEDVAAGIELALERGRSGRRYLLTESSWTHLELMRMAARELGVRPPRARVPGPLWRGVVLAAGLLDRFRPQDEVTPQALRLLGAHYRFDSRRAREELGWRPRAFAEVLRETVAWLRSKGELPG